MGHEFANEKTYTTGTLSYIVDQHSEHIRSLMNHSQDFSGSLIKLEENLKLTNKNLDEQVEFSTKITEKIHHLCKELDQKNVKLNLVNTISSSWPLIILALLIFSAIDYPKLVSLIKLVV